MGLFFCFNEYDTRDQSTPERQQLFNRVMAMSDDELRATIAYRDEYRARQALAWSERTPEEQARLNLVGPAQDELRYREINRRMDQAGFKQAAIYGALFAGGAYLLNRPLWWLYGATAATAGYGGGRCNAAPRGSW